MAGVTVNDLLDAILAERPLAPPYPAWRTGPEIRRDLLKERKQDVNENQLHTRLAKLIKEGKAEKRRGPRRTGEGGGTVFYYHFIGNGKK